MYTFRKKRDYFKAPALGFDESFWNYGILEVGGA